MSTTTANLELFKYNTTTDASTPFSINTALNDNWDKIDAFASGIDMLFNGDLSDATGKNLFSDINTELGKKLEADVLLEENGYIKFNSLVTFASYFTKESLKFMYAGIILYIKSIYETIFLNFIHTLINLFNLSKKERFLLQN